MARDKLPSKSSAADINAFLNAVERAPRRVKGGKRGRLLFAMDATASREPTWDLACHIQASMFSETSNLGGLELSLCYYGGFGKFKATGWLSDSASLSAAKLYYACKSIIIDTYVQRQYMCMYIYIWGFLVCLAVGNWY